MVYRREVRVTQVDLERHTAPDVRVAVTVDLDANAVYHDDIDRSAFMSEIGVRGGHTAGGIRIDIRVPGHGTEATYLSVV